VSKLTGNVDPQKIVDLAPGELNNLPGWKAMNEGEASTLGEYPAYQLGGTWTQDGQTKIVAQKTVVIPGSDGLYVLQLNADGLEDQGEIIGAATDVIDDRDEDHALTHVGDRADLVHPADDLADRHRDDVGVADALIRLCASATSRFCSGIGSGSGASSSAHASVQRVLSSRAGLPV
jgi:hypothetical protein